MSLLTSRAKTADDNGVRQPIHQVVVSASPADAVTNAALELRRLLRRVGKSEIFARLLALGPVELSSLRERVALALAVSAYNARGLEALGYEGVRVCPMPVDVSSLTALEPDPPTSHHLQEEMEGPMILFVGQLLPHKRPDLLIQAYHVLATYLRPDAHLVLVGAGRDGRYPRALQQFVHELNLPRAWLTGRVSPAALCAFYRRADLLVTASEHEGLCQPLLEAMGFGVPVVARDFAAVKETLGGAGIVLPGEDRMLLAEAWAQVLEDQGLRQQLAARGHRRLADFNPEVARATFLEHLASVA